MNGFDREILTWMNGFARTSYPFDVAIAAVATSNALKGGLATVLLAWLWFTDAKDQRRNREVIVATFLAAAVAILAGRLLATVLPFRLRPAHNPALGFVQPYGYPDILRGWSAFPSYHAMLFMAIATGLWFLSRRLGAAAYAYVVLVILAPRVYLGMHHPTDVLIGAGLGIALAAATNIDAIRFPPHPTPAPLVRGARALVLRGRLRGRAAGRDDVRRAPPAPARGARGHAGTTARGPRGHVGTSVTDRHPGWTHAHEGRGPRHGPVIYRP